MTAHLNQSLLKFGSQKEFFKYATSKNYHFFMRNGKGAAIIFRNCDRYYTNEALDVGNVMKFVTLFNDPNTGRAAHYRLAPYRSVAKEEHVEKGENGWSPADFLVLYTCFLIFALLANFFVVHVKELLTSPERIRAAYRGIERKWRMIWSRLTVIDDWVAFLVPSGSQPPSTIVKNFLSVLAVEMHSSLSRFLGTTSDGNTVIADVYEEDGRTVASDLSPRQLHMTINAMSSQERQALRHLLQETSNNTETNSMLQLDTEEDTVELEVRSNSAASDSSVSLNGVWCQNTNEKILFFSSNHSIYLFLSFHIFLTLPLSFYLPLFSLS